MPHYLKTLAVCMVLTSSLSACVGLAVGGLAAGSVTAADRRSTGTLTDDEVMENRIQATAFLALRRYNQNPYFTPSISVVSYNRRILLLGFVGNQAEKQMAERIARAEKSINGVYNYINVVPSNYGFPNYANDAWITAQVRARLLVTKGIYAGNIKIVTYSGVTYIMGILTPNEQAITTQAVRTTAGVQQVVTLYETVAPLN